MLRSEAIERINEGLGFRKSGNTLEQHIILRLQEAQRDLERGKTLPRFLLQEDQTLTLTAATHSSAKPTGFLRESDENRLHYFVLGSDKPIFLARRYYIDAVIAQLVHDDELPRAPSVYVIRNSTIDFITTADITYTLRWDYYKAAELLTTDIENEWLANAPEWLIGEAGYRIAMSTRDKDAVALFNDLRTSARAATFAEDLAAELASGPLHIGANQ